VRRHLWTLTAAAVSVIFLAPVALMVLGSLREPGLAPPRGVEIVPAERSTEAYESAFDFVPLAQALGNSLLVAAIMVPLSILFASLAGYGISGLRTRRRRWAIATLLVLLAVPISSLWLARFAVFEALGLLNGYIPLVAPALLGGSPLFVLLFVLAFRRIPPDVLDAARLEGASQLRTWWEVAMPLVKGTTVAVGLLAFALTWGNFIDPLLYLSDPDRYTAPLVLRALQQAGPTNWPVMLAGATVVTAPVVVAFSMALRLIIPRKGAGWAS
jgi:multiple sugar transport system permease protein